MNYPRWLRAFAHLDRLTEVWRCVAMFRRPILLLSQYLRFGRQTYPLVLQTRQGRCLEATSYHDLVTIWVIFCRQEYGMPVSVRSVLDIGANFGAFSLWANHRAPQASIVAVEPFPDCYARLQHHIQTNGLTEQISVWNIGLGLHSQDRYTGATGEEPGCPTQSRAFVGAAVEGMNKVKISIFSLGDLVSKTCTFLGCDEIDFVKLDVEGVEHSAIDNASIHALTRVRSLSMEYHPNGSKIALFKILADAGLHCTKDVSVHENSGVAWFTRAASRSARSEVPR